MITACNKTVSVEDNIRTEVKDSLPQLAVMEAVYLAQYTNFEKSFLHLHDDFYLKKVMEERSYGFDADDVLKSLRIEERQGDRFLAVKIPAPKRQYLTENRITLLTVRKRNDFEPEEGGKKVDVAKFFTEEIDEQESILNQQLVKDAKRYTEIYFESLARKFGMKADVQFIDG